MSQSARRSQNLAGPALARAPRTPDDSSLRTVQDPPSPVSTVTARRLVDQPEAAPRYFHTHIAADETKKPIPAPRGLPRATADQSGVIRVATIPTRVPVSATSQRPVMLVQVGASSAELRLNRLPIPTLEVRYSLPALTRMRVMRPQLVVIGETVSRELAQLLRVQAKSIGADVLELHRFVPAAAVGPWVKDTLARIANRQRAASMKAALPSFSVA